MREIKFREYFKDGGYIDVNLFGQNPPLQRGLFLAVVQFTGLTDKNGVEIYEGDIIYDDWDNAIGQVIFEMGAFCFETNEPADRVSIAERYHRDCGIILEVIGNIYEHSHLLEE